MTGATSSGKPRLRGVFHLIAALATPLAVLALLRAIPSGSSGAGVVLGYGASMAATFGVSAAYHVPTWGPKARSWWRQLDHAAIFALVYGTYLPICRLGLPPATAEPFLTRIGWACAGGAAAELLRLPVGKPVRVILFLIIGWYGVTLLPAMLASLGPAPVALFAGGGLVYSIGAVIYALKRPNPLPGTLGHHELFHLLVIVACAMQFAVVWHVAARTPPM